jgi:mono/diheme cytochrome c family protein
MKTYFYISVLVIVLFASCNGVKRKPGTVYMPDMAYSRTHESYAPINDSTFTNDTSSMRSGDKYFFNASPVLGTVRKGDSISYEIPQDLGKNSGDTLNYYASSKSINPLGTANLNDADYKAIDRLYNINCGICHGTAMDGNGPLYKSGKLANQPAVLNGTNAKYASQMTEGTMFYSITYGKNSMGGYASQLTKAQRWQMTKYIKMRQLAGSSTDSTTTAKK